jgi:uncharacterized BrkB/YihY/UPF0761 family membrane protein
VGSQSAPGSHTGFVVAEWSKAAPEEAVVRTVARWWRRYWESLPVAPRNYIRGQGRFGVFMTACFLFLITALMIGVVVYSAVAGDASDVIAGSVAGVVALAGVLALWRIHAWWWPPIRAEDLPRHNRKRRGQ